MLFHDLLPSQTSRRLWGITPKVCGDQAGDNSRCLPGLSSLIPLVTTQAFPKLEKVSIFFSLKTMIKFSFINLLNCFLNAVILHHAQHPLAAKFLSSFASPLKGYLLCLALNLHLVALLTPPTFCIEKRHWTVNPSSVFLDCSGPYKHPAQLCQFRLGVLICSAIPVSLCTWGFELPLVHCSPLFQLCCLLFQTGNQSCTQHPRCTGFILTWCCLVVWSVFLPQLFYLLF